MLLGEQWGKSIKNTLTSNEEKERTRILETLDNYETKSQEIIENLINNVLQESINNCIAKKHSTLSISVPFYLIDTKAYRSLQKWARKQKLDIRLLGYLKENTRDEEEFIILNVTPIISTSIH